MLEKTLFFWLLIYLSNSQIVNLTVFQLKDYENITIQKSSGLVCYELHKDFETNKDFNLIISSDEKDKKMNRTIYYNLTDISCQNLNNLTIDFDNLKSEFTYSIKEPTRVQEKYGLYYEYKITKNNENQKFMLMLFKDFTGEKFELTYAPFNAGQAMTFVLVILAVILIIIIIICICVCRCICKKNKAVPFQDEQGQKTFNLQTMPEDKYN